MLAGSGKWPVACGPHWPRLTLPSVSNRSGLPGFGAGWTRTEGPGPGQEPPSNPTRFVLAGCYPDWT